jgi:hypothetical protein
MTAITKLQKPVCQETVDILSECLAMAKRGEFLDVVVVGNVSDKNELGFYRCSSFKDRWRLLGALEYAKDGVHRS